MERRRGQEEEDRGGGPGNELERERERKRERVGRRREYVRHDSYTFITNAYEHVRLYVSAL